MNEIIKKNGVLFGVITGLVSALITTLIYSIDLKLFTAWWVTVLSFCFYIVIAIVLLSKTKKELLGVFPFKDAFTTYFISAAIGILISVVFNILLFNVIDPSAKESVKEISIKYAVEMMEKFNTPASTINEAIKKLQENDQFSIIELLKGSAFSIVFSALFGLLLALVFKSKSSQE
jgi:cbb3-type cytochrome oxidase subunit 3